MSSWPPPPPPPGYGPPGYGPPGYPPPYGAATPDQNPLAVASLVTGILALLTSFCCGLFTFPLAIAAVVTGILGLNQGRDQPSQARTMCIAGICCGAASFVLSIVFVALSFGLSTFSSF